jgi:hypothetical protein
VLQTYVYEVTTGPYAGWWPAYPSEVIFAYSVLGVLGTTAVGEPAPQRSPITMRALTSPAPWSAAILLNIRDRGTFDVRVLDVAGREVRSERLDNLAAGTHRIDWAGTNRDGHTVPSGVYLIEVTLDRDGARSRVRVVLRPLVP